ncbi:MAG: hypothetical protein RL341_1437 [Pseudomonadota bacterium]|jgi:TRAP-type uncharacterized transport system substrate-binding protein
MPKVLKNAFLSLRDASLVAGPFVLLAVVLLAIAYWLLDPAPPKRVVLATGPEQSAYEEFGKRYVQALARYGIKVELVPSAGSLENLNRLKEPGGKVQLAFVQGGSTSLEESEQAALISLGSLFYEPVWLFYRTESAKKKSPTGALTQLADMQGWRVNAGLEGGGVRNLVLRLLQANRIEPTALTMTSLPPTESVMELLAGSSDAVFFVSAPESPLVQMLLQTPGISLFAFGQAEAYARRFPFVSSVTLPRGIVDLGGNLPPQDIPMIAPTATLVAREGTHPALIQLFVQAAADIHGGAGWFRRAGEFPNAKNNEMPVAKEASKFYRDGAPLLQRYLPFWLANLIERMWPALVSIIAVLLPLSRIIPPIYEFRVRSRIFRWYGQLRAVEDQLADGDGKPAELLAELDAMEAKAERITVPLAYADELYALRSHIDMVRMKLKAAKI